MSGPDKPGQGAPSALPAQPALPPLIDGKYRVTGILGQGGMGSVYVAENTWTRRKVAVKVMHPETADNPAFVQRFMREAQAAAQLGHPNIVDVLDMGRDPDSGGFYIVQEFLTGRDLRARLKAERKLRPSDALDIALPVMEALATAHERGIVHRDLKPDNIFLSETHRGVIPKVIDFGIAKVTLDEGDGLLRTSTGQVIGTPVYMSPEQAAGESDVDARSDVWSMGVLLYEMLSGALPFASDKLGRLVAEIIMGQPRPLANAAPHLPASLVRVVHDALRPRSDRYPTMLAFHRALSAVRADADAASVGPWPPDAVVAGGTAPITHEVRAQTPLTADLSPEVSVGTSVEVSAPGSPPEGHGSTGLHWSGQTHPPLSNSRRGLLVAAAASLVSVVGIAAFAFHSAHVAHAPGSVPRVEAAQEVQPSPIQTPPVTPIVTPALPSVVAPALAADASTGAALTPDAGIEAEMPAVHPGARTTSSEHPRGHAPHGTHHTSTGPGFEAE